MPLYSYFCKECLKSSDINHLMDEVVSICPLCSFEGNIERIPSKFRTINKVETTSNPGEVIKESMEEIDNDIKEEKERLKGREWK